MDFNLKILEPRALAVIFPGACSNLVVVGGEHFIWLIITLLTENWNKVVYPQAAWGVFSLSGRFLCPTGDKPVALQEQYVEWIILELVWRLLFQQPRTFSFSRQGEMDAI